MRIKPTRAQQAAVVVAAVIAATGGSLAAAQSSTPKHARTGGGGRAAAVTRKSRAHKAHAAAAEAATPTAVTELPATLPTNGVEVNHQVVLKPEAAGNGVKTITESEALADASNYIAAEEPTKAMLANITVPGTISTASEEEEAIPIKTIENDPTWIVTVTGPEPVNVVIGGRGHQGTYMARSFSVALNAQTGAFLTGFFTE
jgi:hypothetical protein